MNTKSLVLSIGFVGATAAMAHQGVQNPAVMERMNLMSSIAEATKTLGSMAKGAQPFSAEKAALAKVTLQDHADQVDAVFATAETDPMSEARPEIWSDWDGFLKANAVFADAAAQLDTTSLDGLRATMGGLGQSCSGCHEAYRTEN